MYESYLKLGPNDLHDHLTKKLKMHPVRVAQIQTEVAAIKEAKRVERISDTVYKKSWYELLNPLRVELDNAKVGMRYKSGRMPTNEKRVEAFAAYIKVMEEVLRRLSWPSSHPTETPRSWAKKINAEKRGSPIPNEGQHWTDWIPPRVKNAVSDAFAELIVKPTGRRKIPFQRTIPREQHIKAKETLLKRTISDQATIERMWKINPTEDNAELYIRVNKALRDIEAAHPNELLPGTWHGMEDYMNIK